ncbi:Nucleoside diphosphate kinase [Cytospora mali]|uniref:Nucleoside diphosphate kinase n=1 Tax=Cytospora mali TaxID=578113 RepID=A0A194V8L4_CYTMA|nr:Nucleoside diphosphate kinase [Valsa mali var. pyri (nom. inval.)]
MPRTAHQIEQLGEAPEESIRNRGVQGQRRPAGAFRLTPPTLAVLLAAIVAVAVLSQNLFFSTANLNLPTPEHYSIVNSSASTTTQTLSLSTEESTREITMSSTEQTFIAIKPDGVQRGLVGPIISRFEQRGYKLVAIKLVTPPKEHLEAHYADLKEKPFFPGLLSYMMSGPICAMVWEGRDAVKTGRVLLGATNPLASAPGTIRGDFSIDVGRNVCHGSDAVESAKHEIALWFKPEELVSYKSAQFDWVYEKP